MTRQSNLTPLLANDHRTNAFAKLSHRIEGALDYMSVKEIVAKLQGEGHDMMDIHFALAAARILRADKGK
jgi:hypothetical protein